MIVLDTSVIIDSLTGEKRLAGALRRWIAASERRLLVPALVLYEWLRAPALAGGAGSARSLVSRKAGAAVWTCAITRDAELWTLNGEDFRDLPGLRRRRPA